jgi:hypothetical protein
VQRVVVTAEAEDNGLFRGGLFLDNVVRLAILWHRLALRRSSNELGELLSGNFGTKIEGGGIELGVHLALRVNEKVLGEENNSSL